MTESAWWSLISQRPLTEKPSDAGHCPYCQSTNVLIQPGWSTMIGGGDGTVDGDPNHLWNEGLCRSCKRTFLRELKSGNVWYTAGRDRVTPSRVLEGVSNCFEAYAYTCVACCGDVLKRRSALDGSGLGGVIRGWGEDAECLTWYACESCGAASEKVRGDL